MNALLMALLLTSTSPATPDYCEGFKTCTWTPTEITFDLTEDLWPGTRARSVRSASEAYCLTYPNGRINVILKGGTVISGECSE